MWASAAGLLYIATKSLQSWLLWVDDSAQIVMTLSQVVMTFSPWLLAGAVCFLHNKELLQGGSCCAAGIREAAQG